MPQLSIIIAYCEDSQRLERTLVSVLPNRPPACEILVVHRGTYADPYDLGDEVCFVQVPAHAHLVDCLNAGVRAARGQIVHLVQCGVEVEEGWTTPAVGHFDDPRVGMVSPLVLDGSQRKHVLTAGVRIGWDGSRRSCPAGRSDGRSPQRGVLPAGPSQIAGFYRRSALQRCGGFSPAVGDQLADLDIALSIRAIGLACRLEPRCRVYTTAPFDNVPGPARNPLDQGRAAARLIWRHAPTIGRFKVTMLHPVLAVVELVRGRAAPSAWARVWGRLIAGLEVHHYRRHYRRLRDANMLHEVTAGPDDSVRTWIDQGHSAGKPTLRVGVRQRSV